MMSISWSCATILKVISSDLSLLIVLWSWLYMTYTSSPTNYWRPIATARAVWRPPRYTAIHIKAKALGVQLYVIQKSRQLLASAGCLKRHTLLFVQPLTAQEPQLAVMSHRPCPLLVQLIIAYCQCLLQVNIQGKSIAGSTVINFYSHRQSEVGGFVVISPLVSR